MTRSFLRHGYTTVIDLAVTDRDVLREFNAAPVHPDAGGARSDNPTALNLRMCS